MARKAPTKRKPRVKQPSQPASPVQQLAIRSVRIIFNVEQLVNGQLVEVREVPVMVYEGQFNQSLRSLATTLLEQASRSSEPKTKGEDQKEE